MDAFTYYFSCSSPSNKMFYLSFIKVKTVCLLFLSIKVLCFCFLPFKDFISISVKTFSRLLLSVSVFILFHYPQKSISKAKSTAAGFT